ncbi:MAG: SAM-dependent methyltransferase [Planctomycetaceae bacterium]|nr:SAM-dependent methyltransferase [Planctomycetaceae bacterium]
MSSFYGTDVSYIHDRGFSQFAERSRGGLLQLLSENGVTGGRVVDLGCGGGISTAALAALGFQAIGVDQSSPMLKLARRRLPTGTFLRGTLEGCRLPRCEAITAVGEVLNYDPTPRRGGRLRAFFARAYGALGPGGLLIFDIREPLRRRELPPDGHWQGPDWACLVRQELAPRGRTLTRYVTSFRQLGKLYRRQEEVHVQHLFTENELVGWLKASGFRVRTRRSYGDYRLRSHHLVVIARKPPRDRPTPVAARRFPPHR